MGCDIHLWFEKKNPAGKWEKIDIPEDILPDDRNYRVFSFLADVRNFYVDRIEPQFAHRNKPNDTSCDESDSDFWLGDHSFTHAYLDEILKAPWEKYQLEECYFLIFCKYLLARILRRWVGFTEEEKKNIRVIMGFDN